MLEDLIVEAQCNGLEVHMGKTKVLSNEIQTSGQFMQLARGRVQILTPNEHADYLGRRLCMGSLHDNEIDARLERAWK
eukprot:6945286-Karenia_brevis.AAC.1